MFSSQTEMIFEIGEDWVASAVEISGMRVRLEKKAK
jgi:hypothetical protein